MINACIKSLMMMIESTPIHHVLNCLLEDIARMSGSISGLVGKKHIRTDGEVVYRYYGIVGFSDSSQIYKKFEQDGYIDNNVHLKHVKEEQTVLINNDVHLDPNVIPIGHPNIKKAVFICNEETLLILGSNDDYQQSRLDDYQLYGNLCNIFLKLCLERETYFNDRVMFLLKISQELRAPIMGIIHSGKKVNENPRTSKKYLEILNTCCLQLLDVVNDVIDYTNILNKNMHFRNDKVTLNDLFEYVKEFTEPKLNSTVKLHLEYPKSLPKTVYADNIRLTQLFLNILDNSCKFTDCGSITLKVQVLENNQHAVTMACEITDTGAGLSEQMLMEIFSISDLKAGLGVGLIIAKYIVEHYGGNLEIQNNRNVGTTVKFSISLPKENHNALHRSMNYILMESSGNTDMDTKLHDMLKKTSYRVIVAIDRDQLISIVEKKAHEIKKIVLVNAPCISLIRRFTHEHILLISTNTEHMVTYPNVTVIEEDYDDDDIASILEEKPKKPKALIASNNEQSLKTLIANLKDTFKIVQVHDGLELFMKLNKTYKLVVVDYDLTILDSVTAVKKNQKKNSNIYFLTDEVTDKFKSKIYQEGVDAKGFLRTPIAADDLHILKQNLRI